MYKISWGEYQFLVNTLASKIKLSGKEYTKIYAISKDSLPIATSLSYLLGIEEIITNDLLKYDNIENILNNQTLVVNNIDLEDDYNNDTACLIYKNNKKRPTYWAREMDELVIFPWENKLLKVC